MPLSNPSITSPRTGSRVRNKSPRDMTGRRSEELQAEHAAKRAAASLDVEEVRKAAWHGGFSGGWDAAISWVIETYGLDADQTTENQ